ncbi:MAG: periplasmic sensor hybrid histidine kinase [Gemmatimonadetes bacterium]|nr:periplasmic sensor hybrid histidine kinase [Gemmatimonadota bacterium]
MTSTAPGTGTLRARARRSSLSAKLAVLGAAVTAVVVFAAFWALSAEIKSSTRQLFATQLAQNQRTLQVLQAREASQLLFAASLITQTPSFHYDLSIYKVEKNSTGKARLDLVNTLEDELRKRLRSVDADVLLVTDDSARVFAAAGRRGATIARGTSLLASKAVRQVLDPNLPADFGDLAVLRTDSGELEIAVYPLVLDGFTLGALVLGRRLDSAFVATARAASDAEVVLTVGSSVVSASDQSLGTPAVRSQLEPHAADSSAATVRLGDAEYVVAAVPIGETQDHQAVRLWMLQPLTRRVAALTAPLRRDFLLYGGLAVLIAGFGTAFVARTVLGPFRKFVRHMRSGAASEQRQAQFDADREALEVRTLNDSFNQLMDSIARKRRQLEERTAELAAANVVLTDEIAERIRIEKALRESEAQLRQSQKLEAIGTLAGGIAHDFNNLITVISGYTQLALMRTNKTSPEAEDLRQVIDASDRAANLTHQLLAFSRKQVMQPTVLDLGDVVKGIAPMLRRIIGEQIELRIESGPPLARVRADRGQLEQVLLNLAVNARDAMAGTGGGILTIATTNVLEPAAAADAERTNACAVALVVSDTGTGMSNEVKERIFEPFFTTKEVGKGTGLGLSTVYGIVNQSGGAVSVESELGTGSSFTITLPTAETLGALELTPESDETLPSGTETILIVEDAEDVRILARRTLQERGYTVYVARNASEALEIGMAGKIDVLLTDIVMPHTSGPQLVAEYLATRPAPVVIYMSGYADEALAQYELDPATVFLRKPFTPATLARTIRDALAKFALATLVLAAGSRRVHAQGGVLLQGVADAEFWSTNASSNLLTRNKGRPAGLGRVQLWGAYEPVRGLVFYAQGMAEGGPARVESDRYDVYSNQFGVRYASSRALVIDVGRLTPVIGTFASRRFSTRNPLIGLPDGYSLDYPLGAEISGETTHLDYRAAMVSLPADHVGYVPSPTPRLRPAIGGGITPFVGLRVGASFTAGSYLNRDLAAAQYGATDWTEYQQRVFALDASFSRGYLETHAEFARGNYDVPGRTTGLTGYTYYGEAKYTLSPRLFVAVRLERNKYPFIRPAQTVSWSSRLTDFVDGETGVGYRLTSSTLLKASVRADRWWIRPGTPGFYGQGGHAIAMQLSQAFDVLDWFNPAR